VCAVCAEVGQVGGRSNDGSKGEIVPLGEARLEERWSMNVYGI
jgi:hypothetical protein